MDREVERESAVLKICFHLALVQNPKVKRIPPRIIDT